MLILRRNHLGLASTATAVNWGIRIYDLLPLASPGKTYSPVFPFDWCKIANCYNRRIIGMAEPGERKDGFSFRIQIEPVKPRRVTVLYM
jgi:hypothetical protein